MAGFQEILVLVAIVLAVFFIPRITSKRPMARQVKRKPGLSGKMRIAIAASIVYPFLPAVYFKPWQQNLASLALFGIVPVLLGWLAAWVYAGFRKK
jgi:uncharacterized membrane protein (DUF4010 family)